jgi:HD-GYP domain-containing protein (c-di-GMP phosphodiesterase class II)
LRPDAPSVFVRKPRPLAIDRFGHNVGVAVQLRLAELLAGLSTVADMGYGLPVGEAVRSCVIGTALARRLDVPDVEVAETFYTSLLAHIGCVGFAHEMASTFGDENVANQAGARTNFADPRDVLTTLIPETVRGMRPAARVRAATFIVVRGRALGRRYDATVCEVGRTTARRIGLSDGVQRSLYEVREWWNGSGSPQGLKGDEIRLAARIAKVAADAALFTDLEGRDSALDALSRRAGGMLDPSLVAELAAHPALLDEVDAGDPRERMLELEPTPFVEKDHVELIAVSAAFGDLVDLKTAFTAGHSRAVASLAKAAAETLALDDETVEQVEVAGHLHDVGRVGVRNAVWEKAGTLSSAEWEQVRLHPYYSERILSSCVLLEPIARLAGMHHERLDGSGYHRGCRARDLPVGVRVLSAADSFHAMTQPRPHRAALTVREAAEQLKREASAGLLDSDAIAAVVEASGQARFARARNPRPAALSEREVEVLQLVATACSNREIAERLHISRRTAEHHVQHIYRKIGVSTRSAVALFAAEHDLLPTSYDR